MTEGIVNLGGVDISGTLANRPTNAPAGVPYYATDTAELYVSQGSGDNWLAVSGDDLSILLGAITGGDSSLDITGEAGTAGSGTTAGTAGGSVTQTGGAGGAKADTGAAAGGAGAASGIVGGAGGATASSGSDNGGAGGAGNVTGGAGGNATAGTGDGGAGAPVNLTPGAGGTSAGGNAGARGTVNVVGAALKFGAAQTIDMSDAQVALTRVPGTPSGTELVSNVLYVDANSGATEDLLLPPEADCDGLLLYIKNTGGESIVLKDDGDATTVATITTGAVCLAACDGTTWSGGLLS